MKEMVTKELSVEVRSSYNSHAGATFWKVWLYDDATGLSLQVGDSYYTTKYKAEAGFEEALRFLKHSLQLKEQAA